MHIGIIGGGLMGTALAYFLSASRHKVTLLEQAATLGGVNSAVTFADGLSINRYHHALHPGDTTIRDLCTQLNLSHTLTFSPAYMGFVHNGSTYPLNNIWDFFSFAPLRPLERLHLAQVIRRIQQVENWRTLEGISARDWLVQLGGESAFQRIWLPLLEARFDNRHDTLSAVYIWAAVRQMMASRHGLQMHSSSGGLREGHMTLIQGMADVLRQRGGEIYTETRVREIEVRGGQVQYLRTLTGMMHFDLVIATVPTPTLARLLPAAHQDYLDTLEQVRYLGLICPAVVLNRPLSSYNLLKLTDPSSPFTSLIETPHPVDAHYHVIYLPRYTAPEDDWQGVSDSDIEDAWLLRLRQLFPLLRPYHIEHFAVSRTRYAEPVHTLHASQHIVPLQTPYSGLLLANASQIYPGLPTSENVLIHARRIAQQVAQLPQPQAETAV